VVEYDTNLVIFDVYLNFSYFLIFADDMKGKATVIKNAGSHFMLSELPEWKPFPAVLKGVIRLSESGSTNPVAVGDLVEWAADKEPDFQEPASIVNICDRKNCIVRRPSNLSKQTHVIAANLDTAFIVVTLYFPQIKLPFLDRFLVTCEAYGVPVKIVLNKIDIFREEFPEEVEHFEHIYKNAGYEVIETSATEGEGIERLRNMLPKGSISLVAGESGVGKSSIIKALDPALNPKTADISLAHLQGRHTTSLYEMYPLSSGSFMIDSPGLRGFGLIDFEKEEIYKYFPEMLKISEECRFNPCTHTHEPGCAVKAAVESGTIAAERYSSYLGMLEEDKKFR
jgi:ribosome biogenesis GTPase